MMKTTSTPDILAIIHAFLDCVLRVPTHVTKTIQKVAIAMGVVCVSLCASAHAAPSSRTYTVPTQEVYLTVSQYELALVQVLSEICPPMLDNNQKYRFNRAYNAQLQIFMPYALNPQQTLRQLTTRRDYRIILQKVRAWTKSYPISENRALCREFAQMAF